MASIDAPKPRGIRYPPHAPIAVYFLGVGEALEDLETFNAREFANALLG